MDQLLDFKIIYFFKCVGVSFAIWFIGYLNFSITYVVFGVLVYFLWDRNKNLGKTEDAMLQTISVNEKNSLLSIYKHLPSWVLFFEVERAEWLNKILRQMWPFISSYVVNILKTSVTEAIKKNLPSKFLPFKFLKLDFGDITPQIGGIQVFTGENIGRDEIQMDIDIFYYGDCDIQLKANLLKAGIKDVKMRGHLRIVLKPLVPQIPIIGSVSVCFLKNPTIKFDLTGIGNIAEIPGLKSVFETIIRKKVEEYVVLPNRIVIPLMNNLDVIAMKYPMPQGVVRFTIVSASGIKASDTGILWKKGKSDPYVVAEVGAQSFKTKTIKYDLNPVWNETFEAIVAIRDGQELTLRVFDEDVGNDDFLGSASIDLEEVSTNGSLDKNFPLKLEKENESTQSMGSIHVKITWMNLSSQTSDINMNPLHTGHDCVEKHGLLHCVLDSCRNLPLTGRMEEPSLYVKLKCSASSDKSKKSSIKANTTSPVFQEAFQFLLTDPQNDVLIVRVFDSKNETAVGNVSIPLKLLLSEPDMMLRQTMPYRLQDCARSDATVNLRLALRALVSRDKTISTEKVVDEQLIITNTESTITKSTAVDSGSGDVESVTKMTVGVRQRLSSTPAPYGRLNLTLRYSVSRACLVVVVLQAAGLVGCDEDNLADPFVKLSIQPRELCGVKKKTAYKKNQLSPTFDETFEFPVAPVDLDRCVLRISIRNHVGMSLKNRKKDMGFVDVNLANLANQSHRTEWFTIKKENDSKAD